MLFSTAGTGGLHLGNRHQTLLEALQKWRAFRLCGCDGNWHTCEAQTFALAGSNPAIRTRGRIAKTGRHRIADPKMREFDSHSGLQRFFDNQFLGAGSPTWQRRNVEDVVGCGFESRPAHHAPIDQLAGVASLRTKTVRVRISLGVRPDGQNGKGAALRRRRCCEFESHSGHQVWAALPQWQREQA